MNKSNFHEPADMQGLDNLGYELLIGFLLTIGICGMILFAGWLEQFFY